LGSQAEASQPCSGGGEGAAAPVENQAKPLSIYLINKKQFSFFVRLKPEMHNPQRFETMLWERLSGEANGKALPHN
jgi:hypothetical protein